ncbi:MAG: DegV family protein [Sciscionella sp.]|nr:DegV family protein [Sciscionella sp.]
MRVAVITDSTAYLPEGFAQRYSIGVVPLHVEVDGESMVEGVEFGPARLAAALAEHKRVTTSRPTPVELANAYTAALHSGADAVVAVHLSSQLSGTWDAARLAAEDVGADRVHVVDSRSTAMGLGFAVLAAASAAVDGADPVAVQRIASDVAGRTSTYFCVPTLEYLRRGGRIGTAAALFGTALAVKPLLHVDAGKIEPLEKVRTMAKAVARLVELAATAAGTESVGLAVHHLAASELAADLANRLDERLPGSRGCLVSEVGAVIGAHTGPGMLGVVVLPDVPGPVVPDVLTAG